MEVQPRHWGLALLAAVALHSCPLLAFWRPSNAGTPAAGTGGIEVSLGPAGAARGIDAVVAEAEVQAAEAAVTTPPEAQVAQPVETVPEVAPIEPAPMAEPAEPAEPLEAPPIELAEAVPPPPDVPPAKPQPPEPAAVAAPAPMAPAPPAASPGAVPKRPVPERVQSAAIPGDQGQGGNTKFTEAGTGDVAPGAGVPGGPSAYNDLLSAWLQKHHEFPARAERRKMYGKTKVRFTIDLGGNPLDYEIVGSSGYRILDEAALATLKRASPMPATPADLSGPEYNPTITLGFMPPT